MNTLMVVFQFNAVLLKAIVNFGADVADHPELVLSAQPDSPWWHPLWPVGERFEWPPAGTVLPSSATA